MQVQLSYNSYAQVSGVDNDEERYRGVSRIKSWQTLKSDYIQHSPQHAMSALLLQIGLKVGGALRGMHN